MANEPYDELLRDQLHGHKGRSDRLLGSDGGHYRRLGGGANALARSLRLAKRRPQAMLKITNRSSRAIY